jgi:hypothetical protein
VKGHRVEMRPRVTLNPKFGMRMTAHARGGFFSRFGQHRADTKRLPLDIMTMGATLFVVGMSGYAAFNAVKSAVAPPKKRWLFA